MPSLDIIAPVVMCCALLWWVSRGMTWSRRLTVAAITLVVIVCIVIDRTRGLLAEVDPTPALFDGNELDSRCITASSRKRRDCDLDH